MGWLALAVAVSGCFDDQVLSLPPPDVDPPPQRRLAIGPGEFVEANFVAESTGAAVTAVFSSAGEFEWNLHRHDRDDFREFEVIESGRAVSGTLEFEAGEDGLFSYQWTNLSGVAGYAIEIELTLDGSMTLHSWD